MADPANPTVPAASGVPAVQRNGVATPSSITPVASDGADIVVVAATSIWGIHDTDGDSVFNTDQGPTSYAEVEDDKQYNIPDYPVESGGFQSYNKAERPGDFRLVVTKEGTDSQRQTFRQRLDALQASVQMLNVLTPSRVYKGYNLTGISVQRRAEKGAYLLTLHLTFKQVRNTVVTAFSSVATPSATSNTNSGAVQATTATAAQTPGSSPQ